MLQRASLVFGLVSVSACAVLGATTNVNFANFQFEPVVVHINTGDTVNFVNQGGTHTVTGSGADPVCGDATLTSPEGCSHQFLTAGNYPYFCQFHGSFFNMTGMVVVVDISPPPPPAAPVLTDFVLSNGLVRFTADITPNRTNLVQASSDLAAATNWITIGSNVGAASSFSFTDNAGVFPLRFYRVLAQ
ncbi:MAG TPA: hypothetical protein VHB20_04890 [Verrucomicrobiae bacterium]|jgi:plastocyanin|nr:hypothetical protein [Verrucomicrobiae bacterium]